MSRCFGCYFHHIGCMWNGCDYFKSEYYSEPEDCLAFSVDGSIPAENEAKLFELTDGFFGKRMDEEKDMIKLINAEYLKKYIRKNGLYCDTDADKEISCKVIDSMPTVEAIPIEFVEKEAERMRASENPAMRMNSVILSALIRDWREQ